MYLLVSYMILRKDVYIFNFNFIKQSADQCIRREAVLRFECTEEVFVLTVAELNPSDLSACLTCQVLICSFCR